jgi:hypothetical protein
MKPRLYLNLIPESLVASALEPAAYGSYMAVGLHAKTRGQAIFFDVDGDAAAAAGFAVGEAFERCRVESVEAPKHSVYLSIYRVLERLPVAAMGRLYLTTDDGRVLALERRAFDPEEGRAYHLYQEFIPVKPRVASRLNPPDFCRHVTAPGGAISLPRLVFAELALRGLATDPASARVDDLPYPNLDHLRDCLLQLVGNTQKRTKLVIRHLHQELLYRTVRNGFFVGDQTDFAYYPMPSRETLERDHREWLRSAETLHID